MSGAYIGRTYTITVSGAVSTRARCGHCSTAFEYNIRRNGMGNGHSPFLLNNSGAKRTAERRARMALERALAEAVEPVHCPTCGMYQPEMVRELERRFGVRFDPNEHSAERVTIPFHVIWDKTCQTNTAEAYERFMRIWPIYTDQAKLRLRELRHPLRRRVMRALSWAVWTVIAVGFGGLVLLSVLSELKVLNK
jgi:hypothetical protein